MKININDRIKIKDAEGTVKYVGSLYEKEGVWVGILLDEEKGKNFGILGGKEYFDCNGKRRGIFIKEDLLVNDLMQSKISDDLRVSKDLDENLQARKYKKKYEKLKAHLAMIENLNDQKIKEIRERNKSALKIKDLEIQNLKKNSNTNLENDQVMKNETFILQKKGDRKIKR
ncbi:Dynactin subunit 1 [Gurleya vavrai]